MKVIEVDELTKDYGSRRGVFSVSFQIEKGEVFGFLGPNGAGKTTTIRHLMGFSKPQKGRAIISGMDCFKQSNQILKNIGYLPGEIALPENLTGIEFVRMMQGLRNSHDEKRLKYLMDKSQLDPRGKTKRMSLGNKRILAIITAFMADPEVLLLDEPTSGLDPLMQERFIDFLIEEKKRGKTILLSSHIFSEVDAVCDRIAIIKDGELVTAVNADDIRHNSNKTYKITFSSPQHCMQFMNASGFSTTLADESRCSAEVKIHDSQINQLIEMIEKYKLISFKEEKFTLEKYFLNFYKKGT